MYIYMLAFRWSCWPFTTSTLQKIDSLQNHFTRLLFPLPSWNGEPAESYFARRSQFIGRITSLAGRWSLLWTKRIHSWFQHLERAHDAQSWAPHLVRFQDAQWLEEQRGWHSSSQRRGTGTRLASGQPPRRWTEGYQDLLRRGAHLHEPPCSRAERIQKIHAHVRRNGAF